MDSPPSSAKAKSMYDSRPGYSRPPFTKDVGQVPYPPIQCDDVLSQFSVKRLDMICEHLWLAGRPQSDPSKKASLHKLKATGSNFIIYEQADLHLVWGNGVIYMKPLPRCLLNFEFWQENLCSSAAKWSPDHEDILNGALGLLYSYTWLIRWESDLRIAQAEGLISTGINYETWMAIRSSFLSTFDRDQLQLPWLAWRYDFAELRLNRINLIWRLRPRTPYDLSSLVRGYQNPYHFYTSFFEQNFSIVIVIFVYITVVLSAMQVGLSTDKLQSNDSFQRACIGFTVFCIIFPVAIVVAVLCLFIALLIFNWWITLRHLKAVRPRGSDHD